MRDKSAGQWFAPACLCVSLLAANVPVRAGEPPIFLRFRVQQPANIPLAARLGGVRKQGPKWTLPHKDVAVPAGQWTEWIDLTDWPLHKRMSRAGGIAEWPSAKIVLRRPGDSAAIQGCTVELQLNVRAGEPAVVSATETGGEDTVWFLIPRPLDKNAREFETGSQMTARHHEWARQIVGDTPIELKKFDICTSFWGEPDPVLASKDVQTLKLLGFNVINGAPSAAIRAAGMSVLGTTRNYVDDPDDTAARFKRKKPGRGPRDAWEEAHTRHVVINDEVKALTFKHVEPARRDAWFRAYLQEQHVTDELLGQPVAQATYPFEPLSKNALPREADLNTRRLLYHAARFRHAWSARQLRLTSDLIREASPGRKSSTLPTSHGFFCAWGPPQVGMSYPMLDLFEVGRRHSVDILSVEDWFGLNHMYGPSYTWTGAQSFEYLAAIMRSATAGTGIELSGLITPSDDQYLQLKAFSCLGQGAKSFFFWTYGPTFMGDENYWSDLRSEYEGIARLTRVLQRAEDTLADARVVSDPVAILYSVSHDIWNSDRTAAFVEKRLLWHALRHLSVQPDFLSEQDVAEGKLKNYRILFVTDHCISRPAGRAIDSWVRDGGVVQLSAGAATRDEFNEPSLPAFSDRAWPADVAKKLEMQDGYRFKERGDLSDAPAMAQVRIGVGEENLPVLGCRGELKSDLEVWARFEDQKPASGVVSYGSGRVIAHAFMPMLAYGQLAHFAPKKLAEKWPAAPRQLVQRALDLAKIRPSALADCQVVETSLLRGTQGSALVLANYTYESIDALSITMQGTPPKGAYSCTLGRTIPLTPVSGGFKLTLPLKWTDVVLLSNLIQPDTADIRSSAAPDRKAH